MQYPLCRWPSYSSASPQGPVRALAGISSRDDEEIASSLRTTSLNCFCRHRNTIRPTATTRRQAPPSPRAPVPTPRPDPDQRVRDATGHPDPRTNPRHNQHRSHMRGTRRTGPRRRSTRLQSPKSGTIHPAAVRPRSIQPRNIQPRSIQLRSIQSRSIRARSIRQRSTRPRSIQPRKDPRPKRRSASAPVGAAAAVGADRQAKTSSRPRPPAGTPMSKRASGCLPSTDQCARTAAGALPPV
jgi:hypothetical protein